MQLNPTFALLLLFGWGIEATAQAEPAPPAADSRVSQPGGEFTDPIPPISPRNTRSEADLDRIEAAAHYALGRLLLQRDDLDGALRRMERAWRYDSAATSLLNEIVLVAVQRGHFQEAARYAVLAAEHGSGEFAALRQLANYLAQLRDWERALKLYEKFSEKNAGEKKGLDALLLHWEMGRLYFLTKDYAKSAENLSIVRDALEHPEKYALKESLHKAFQGDAQSIYALLAESFLQAGKFDDALTMFEKVQRRKPDQALLLLQRARVAEKRPDNAAALGFLEKYFSTKSQAGGLEVYDLYAKLVARKNEDQNAAAEKIITRMETLLQNDPDNRPLAYFLAEQCMKLKRFKQAEALYRGQIEAAPTLQAYQGLIEVLHQSTQSAALLDVLGQAVAGTISLDSLGPPVKKLLADQKMRKQLIEEAKKREAANALSPEVALAAAYLALADEQFSDVRRFFQHALKSKKIAREGLLFTWSVQLILAERAADAVATLKQLIDENQQAANLADYHHYLAGALAMAEKTDDAVRAAEMAVTLDPASVEYRARIAWIYYHAHRNSDAVQSYKKLLDNFDQDHAAAGVRAAMRQARLSLSNLAVQENDQAAAVEWLEQVLDEYPEDIAAMNDLGYLWAEQGLHLQRAYRMVARAVLAEPDNTAYLDSLGWALFQLQRYDEAVVALKKSVASDEHPAGVILDHLGDALWQTKAHQEAQDAWRRAMQAFAATDQSAEREKVAAKLKRRPPTK